VEWSIPANDNRIRSTCPQTNFQQPAQSRHHQRRNLLEQKHIDLLAKLQLSYC
jgi:hypothetical protein